MPDPLLYLKSMGAAAIVSSFVVLAMVRGRPQASRTWLNSAVVAGIGLGLAVGCYVLSLRLGWPPANSRDRLLLIVIPAGLGVELIAGFQRVPPWVAWLLRMSLAATIPGILLHGSVYLSGSDDDWPLWRAGMAMAVCTVLLAGSWSLLSLLSSRSAGVSMSLALCLTMQCAGVTVMMAGYIGGGAAAFPLVGALLAMTIGIRLSLRRVDMPPSFIPPAILGIGVVALSGLLFIGCFFGRLSTGSALAMLLAPLLCWATETPLMRNRKPSIVGSLRLVLVAIPLVGVLVLAKQKFDRDMAPLLENVQLPVFQRHVCGLRPAARAQLRLPRGGHCSAGRPPDMQRPPIPTSSDENLAAVWPLRPVRLIDPIEYLIPDARSFGDPCLERREFT